MHRDVDRKAEAAVQAEAFRPHPLDEAEALLARVASPLVTLSPAATIAVDRAAVAKPLADPPRAAHLEASMRAVQHFRAAYEAVPDGLLIADAAGYIVLANSHLAKLFGYSVEELQGSLLDSLLAEQNQDLLGRHRDGHLFPIQISRSSLSTQAGLMVVATIRDASPYCEVHAQLRKAILTLESRVQQSLVELTEANQSRQLEITERQRAEAAIQQMNKDLARAHQETLAANQIKSQFLANMSHELRTPLNVIIGYCELLQLLAAKKNDDTYTADLEQINKAGKHLLLLVNDVLDISKIESGTMQLDLNIIELPALLNEVSETAAPLAAQHGNQLDVEIEQPLGLVEADSVRLKQCLLHLLSNACKFTTDGTVTFSVFHQKGPMGPSIAFRVSDTGIGLSPEQAAWVFDPFTQVDASTTRKFGGSGLGLAITKRLCESMQGSIELESELGQGATVTIRLPVRCEVSP